MKADDGFVGMIAVCFQLASDRRTFGALRVRCDSLSAAENATSILSDYCSQTF
jgi:hypothetical protein